MNEPEILAAMLEAQTIAVVGLSADPAKPSYYVSEYMQSVGKRIMPVNPTLVGQSVLGESVYGSLSELPVRPDLVNVFRLPRFIPAIVEEMLTLRLDQLWVQQGIWNAEAAAAAETGGIRVVMDRCLMIERRIARR